MLTYLKGDLLSSPAQVQVNKEIPRNVYRISESLRKTAA